MVDIDALIWIKADKKPIDVAVYIYVDSALNKINSISQRPIPELIEVGLEEHEIRSQWTIPSRAEMESYKRESSTYNVRSGSILVDEMLLCDCVVSNHIEELSVDGKSFSLQRDLDGQLDAQSIKDMKSLHSGIYDALYAKYCMEACLFV